MRTLFILFLTATIHQHLFSQNSVIGIDPVKYSGKWYVIAIIPTRLDKTWISATESYTLNPDGSLNIFATYKKNLESAPKTLAAKAYPRSKSNNVKWRVKFPGYLRRYYLVQELGDGYSYVVMGDPKKKHLLIMSRTGIMSPGFLKEIVERFRQKGYNTDKLKLMLP